MNRIENGIARVIGKTGVNIEFGIELGKVIYERLSCLNPFATNNFTISQSFDKQTRETLTEAVHKSTLPEDIHIAHAKDQAPPGRFVVVGFRNLVSDVLDADKKGADRYVLMNFDIDQMAEDLTK